MKRRDREILDVLRAADPARQIGDPTGDADTAGDNFPEVGAGGSDPMPVGHVDRHLKGTKGRFGPGRRTLPAAAAAAVLIVAGAILAWPDADTSRPGPSPASAGDRADGAALSWKGLAACSRAIVIGEVISAAPTTPQRIDVTIAVSEWIKPGSGAPRATFNLPDPQIDNRQPFAQGRRLLLSVPKDREMLIIGYYGNDLEEAALGLRDAVADPSIPCPEQVSQP